MVDGVVPRAPHLVPRLREIAPADAYKVDAAREGEHVDGAEVGSGARGQGCSISRCPPTEEGEGTPHARGTRKAVAQVVEGGHSWDICVVAARSCSSNGSTYYYPLLVTYTYRTFLLTSRAHRLAATRGGAWWSGTAPRACTARKATGRCRRGLSQRGRAWPLQERRTALEWTGATATPLRSAACPPWLGAEATPEEERAASSECKVARY